MLKLQGIIWIPHSIIIPNFKKQEDIRKLHFDEFPPNKDYSMSQNESCLNVLDHCTNL